MSQAITTKKFSRASLRQHEAMRSVLQRMAEDQARAERIRALKEGRPDLTWEKIADHVGVKERSVHNWGATGGIKYENAEKLAELFGVAVDYVWRGPDADDDGLKVASPNGDGDGGAGAGSQLDRIERDIAEILRLLRNAEARPSLLVADEVAHTVERRAQKRAADESEREPTSTPKRRASR